MDEQFYRITKTRGIAEEGVIASVERAIAYVLRDAPPGSEWNGMPLKALIESSRDSMNARLARCAESLAIMTPEDERSLRTSLESFIESKRVWQEMRIAHDHHQAG